MQKINESLVFPLSEWLWKIGASITWVLDRTDTPAYTCHGQAGGCAAGVCVLVGGWILQIHLVSFLVPTKCSFPQLSEDQFSRPKRPIKQQNKQRVWRQEPGQGAKLITRDVVVNSRSTTPTFRRRLWGREEGICSPLPQAPASLR